MPNKYWNTDAAPEYYGEAKEKKEISKSVKREKNKLQQPQEEE